MESKCPIENSVCHEVPELKKKEKKKRYLSSLIFFLIFLWMKFRTLGLPDNVLSEIPFTVFLWFSSLYAHDFIFALIYEL